MAESRTIIFPCDHKSWSDIKATLTSAKASRGIEAWITAFQKVHDIVHVDLSLAAGESANCGAKRKTRNVFAGLRAFFDSRATVEESYNYIDNVFPQIVDRALEIEKLRPADGLEILCQRKAESRVISQPLAASIVSCAFLCLFPGKCPSLGQHSRLNCFSFDEFFPLLECDFQCEKLRSILQYFSTLSELRSRPLENLVFSRKVLHYEDVPKPEVWMCSSKTLCDLTVHSPGDVQPVTAEPNVQVMFGSRYYGGTVLSAGHSQEEHWFCEQAELISGILFIESLTDNEALIIFGLDKSPRYLGAAPIPGLIPASVAVSASSKSSETEMETSICIIDSPFANRSDGNGQPYKHQNIFGLLSKILAGICLEKPTEMPAENSAVASGSSADDATCGVESSSGLEEEGTNETDLPSSSNSVGSAASSRCLRYSMLAGSTSSSSSIDHEIMAVRVPPRHGKLSRPMASWRSNSSTESSASHYDEMSRAMSLEADSSLACPTPEDGPPSTFAFRRSSTLHGGVSSRRGSTLQYQSSFASDSGDVPGFGRRRSSTTSEQSRRSSSSSGSSAGKRSSTDYSSEMEEYYENFQRSEIKTSVIEEEAGATSLPEEEGAAAAGVLGSSTPDNSKSDESRPARWRMVQNFSVDRPLDVAKPMALRGNATVPLPANPVPVSCHQMALDHFVDNLINEVAQDSKLEIEEIVREQQARGLKSRNVDTIRDDRIGSIKWPTDLSSGSSIKRTNPIDVKMDFNPSGYIRRDAKTISGAENFKESESAKVLASSGSDTVKHCRSCEKLREEVDEYITDFLNNVFCEAVDVYINQLDRSNETRARVSNQSRSGTLPANGSFHKSPAESQRQNRPLGLFGGTSSGDRHLRPDNALFRTGSMLPSGKETVTEHKTSVKRSVRCRCTLGQLPRSMSHSFGNSSSREYLLSWFSSATSLYTEKAPTSLDWFAQDLLVDTLDGVLVELFGRASLQDALQMMHASTEYVSPDCQSRVAEIPTKGLLCFAENLAQTIMFSGSQEAAQHMAAAGSDGYRVNGRVGMKSEFSFLSKAYSFMPNTPQRLEEIASNFAHQLIEEAVCIVAGSSIMPAIQRSVVTGHCTTGMFSDEPQLLSLLQWIAASMANASKLHYYTGGNTQIAQLDVICQLILNRRLSAGTLLSEIFAWCKRRRYQCDVESLFDFLLIRLT